MTDLQKTGREQSAEIDAVGWLFAVLTVVLFGVAAIIIYEGNSAKIIPPNSSHIASHVG